MNTWNTLPESYQQRVYEYTLATVKLQIKQAENPTPAVAIRVEAARVHNTILLDSLTSEVALEDSGIRRTDPSIPIDKHCADDQLHIRIPEGSGDCEDEVDECDEHDAIPTTSQWWRAATELQSVDLGTSDVNRYNCEDGNDVDPDEEEEASEADDGSTQNVEVWGHSRLDLQTSDVDGYASEDGDDADEDEEDETSQADDGSTQNVEDWGHSHRECDDWTVHFRPVKYDNGEANQTASDVSESKTVL